MVSGIMAWAGAVTPPKNRQGPVILMDEVKHPHADTAGQIDVASIRNCLQEGDPRLALQHCHELLAGNPQHFQTLLFATLAPRSLGLLYIALLVAPHQPAIHSLMGDVLLLQKRPEQALGALMQAG